MKIGVNACGIGHLGSLELKIPWANLKNRPVKVFISDLYILAGPPSEAEVRFAKK